METRSLAVVSLKRSALPNIWDLVALILVFGIFSLIVAGSSGLTVPLLAGGADIFSLDYINLPYYALRTSLRMFAAISASLLFTFTYATWAAKSRRAEMVLIPLLDVLQSVPVLGFLSFTVTFFLGLFPGSVLGAECASVFAIFTSQAWNMAFSFYQSLRTVPNDLEEVSRSLHLSPWQKFWKLETPFAMPGLIWNTMMSMSGGWFFVVASEAISVGDTTIKLPGIGSYLAAAIDAKRVDAVVAAVVTMLLVIILYDQLLFRPVVAWGDKFKVELSASERSPSSWVQRLFHRTRVLHLITRPFKHVLNVVSFWRLEVSFQRALPFRASSTFSRSVDAVWFFAIFIMFCWSLWLIFDYVSTELAWSDLLDACLQTLTTMLRVVALMTLASLFWVPISIWIGLRPRIAERVQPLAQFLAAFPVNVIFPIAVIAILHYHLNPNIWLSFLIVFGTQWYIVFNVIAGASAFPNDLREVVSNLRVKGLDWWVKVILPGIFPYYVTGALTASGGSWNAAIVAEYVKWGDDKLSAYGIGSYIAQATEAGDYPKIVLGVAVMSVFVILFNRLLWRPMFGYAERRLRLS
jgi:NitT/TauT family transport system permease protein